MREWWSWMGRSKEKQTRKKGGLCVEGIRKEEEESEGDKVVMELRLGFGRRMK
jgi:hypothetical protein